MKIEVGDYVRTKDYGFIKIKSFYYNENMILILDENCNEYGFSIELVDDFKSSPSIIDLVQVGDYVNGEKVLHIDNCLYGGEKVIITELNKGIYDNEIKTIVTHEQFNNMEYRV